MLFCFVDFSLTVCLSFLLFLFNGNNQKNQVQTGPKLNPPEHLFLKSLLVPLLQNLAVTLMVIQPYFHSLTHPHTCARAPVSFLKSGRNLFNAFTLMLLTGHFILL